MSSCNSSFNGTAIRTRSTVSKTGAPVRGSSFRTRRTPVTMQKGGTIKFSPAPKQTRGLDSKTTSLPIDTKEKEFRTKQMGTTKRPPKILSKVQELRLLSKLESAGLLSGLEKSGLTLSKIEKAGLLTVAESSGLLSAAGNRQTPGLLFTVAFVLFAIGPAAVYLIPDDTNALIAAQAAVAAIGALGGAAAYGGATLLSTLQD